ncbi:MAG: glycosyl transferase [Subtercola sp.]|nr:glycosyl transferase [Subtercola sp.]
MSEREPQPAEPRRLRIAMVGTRGVPAAYSGFETAVEEIGQRLVAHGHDVTVYCRKGAVEPLREYLGMKLVHLPAVRSKTMETLSHTTLSSLHLLVHRRHDVAFVFNAANAPLVPLIRARGAATAVHVDGLEWKRDKWSGTGKKYYRLAEQFAVRSADALIADAAGIADYYDHEFGVPTELLTYGSTILKNSGADRLAELGLQPGQYHLVVARFEPENHVDVIVEGYRASAATLPLVVVGSAPYSHSYTQKIQAVAETDARIHLLGGVWDQQLLNQLYANALTYSHGHSVGGTNPSLLRAMGAGTSVVAWNVVFNREVLGGNGRYFDSPAELGRLLEAAEADRIGTKRLGERLADRAAARYDWDDVCAGYERLAQKLAAGYSTRGLSKGRRAAVSWDASASTATLDDAPHSVTTAADVSAARDGAAHAAPVTDAALNPTRSGRSEQSDGSSRSERSNSIDSAARRVS